MNQNTAFDAISLNESFVFSRFIEATENQKAAAAARAVAQITVRDFNLLFLHGKVGLGKTHLLQAIGNAISKNSPWLKMQYVTAEGLTDTVISAIGNNVMMDLRRHFQQLDVLLIDDVQFLSGCTWTQEELHDIIDDMLNSNKQIVLSSDRAPEELSELENGLVARLLSGLVEEIQAPGFETRFAILDARNQEYEGRICNAVLTQIAKRITSSVRALEGNLIKVIAHQDLLSRELQLDELDEVLPAESVPRNRNKPDIEHIKQHVAEYYNIPAAAIDGTVRLRKINQACQIAIYLVRKLTNCSFAEIGRMFGQRDYSTVMHAYRTVNSLIGDPIFRFQIEEILRDL